MGSAAQTLPPVSVHQQIADDDAHGRPGHPEQRLAHLLAGVRGRHEGEERGQHRPVQPEPVDRIADDDGDGRGDGDLDARAQVGRQRGALEPSAARGGRGRGAHQGRARQEAAVELGCRLERGNGLPAPTVLDRLVQTVAGCGVLLDRQRQPANEGGDPIGRAGTAAELGRQLLGASPVLGSGGRQRLGGLLAQPGVGAGQGLAEGGGEPCAVGEREIGGEQLLRFQSGRGR